jgi:hypothetical protein
MDQIVLSLHAEGLTTGEISAAEAGILSPDAGLSLVDGWQVLDVIWR